MALTTSTAKAVLAKREALAIAEQELAQAEASFKSLINVTVSHELRGPLNSIVS